MQKLGERPNRPNQNEGLNTFREIFTKEDEHVLAYLETVTDPFAKKNAGVPVGLGAFALETDKFQVILEGDAYAGGGGVAVVTVDCDGWAESANGAAPAYQFASYNGGAQGNPVFYSAKGNTNANTTGFPANGTVPSGTTYVGQPLPSPIEPAWNAQTRVRLVSAGLEIFSDASQNNATGKVMVCSSVLPYEATVGKGGIQGATFAQISSTPQKLIERAEAPLAGWKSGHVMRAFAIPSQAAAFEMNSMPAAGLLNVAYPILGAIGIGMADGQSFSWRVVFNYEAMADFSLKTNTVEREVVDVGSQRVSNSLRGLKPHTVTPPAPAAKIAARPLSMAAALQDMGGRDPMRANKILEMVARPAAIQSNGFLTSASNALGKIANSGLLKKVPVVGGLLDGIGKFFWG